MCNQNLLRFFLRKQPPKLHGINFLIAISLHIFAAALGPRGGIGRRATLRG